MRLIALAAAATTLATAAFADPIALTPSQMDSVTAGYYSSPGVYQSASQDMSSGNFQYNSTGDCFALCNVLNAQTAVTAGLQAQIVNQSATVVRGGSGSKRR